MRQLSLKSPIPQIILLLLIFVASVQSVEQSALTVLGKPIGQLLFLHIHITPKQPRWRRNLPQHIYIDYKYYNI